MFFFCYSMGVLYCLVFLLGFFAGIGIPAAITWMSEVVPDQLRGLLGAALCIGFCLGELWTACGLQLFVPDLEHGPWHYALLWAGIPPLLFFIAFMLCKVTTLDSPHFLAVHGKDRQVCEVLNLMAKMNGRTDAILDASRVMDHDHDEKHLRFCEVIGFITSGS